MQDFTIQRCSRKCARLERPLQPGEPYYSVIFSRGSELQRQDISAEAWDGPPQEAIGWWKSSIPRVETKSLRPAPPSVLVQALQSLIEQGEQPDLAYLLAIHLLRKRILVPMQEGSLNDANCLELCYPVDDSRFSVAVCKPTSANSDPLQQQLVDLLYYEA